MDLKRTHFCGDLREENIGQEVILTGWCQTRRDHGGVIFIDLRDYTGITQVVFKKEISESAHNLADTIAAHMAVKIEEKQHVLGITDVKERLEYLIQLMESEIDLLHVEKKIRGRVKSQMEKSQREYYLNEQMKAIQNELGDMEDVPNEIDDLANKIEESIGRYRISAELFLAISQKRLCPK